MDPGMGLDLDLDLDDEQFQELMQQNRQKIRTKPGLPREARTRR